MSPVISGGASWNAATRGSVPRRVARYCEPLRPGLMQKKNWRVGPGMEEDFSRKKTQKDAKKE